MPLVLLKEPDTKLVNFNEFLKNKIKDTGYGVDGCSYSVLVVPEDLYKPLHYRVGLVNIPQLIRTVVMLHTRKSSVVVVASRMIQPSVKHNIFPPYLIEKDYDPKGDKCYSTVFMPVSDDLGDIDKSGESLSYTKFQSLINGSRINDLKHSFKTLETGFTDSLSSFFKGGALLIADESYGLKVFNKNKFIIGEYGARYINIEEDGVFVKKLDFGLPKAMYDAITKKPPIQLCANFDEKDAKAAEDEYDSYFHEGYSGMGTMEQIVEPEVVEDWDNEVMKEESIKISSRDVSEREVEIIDQFPFIEVGTIMVSKEDFDLEEKTITLNGLYEVKVIEEDRIKAKECFTSSVTLSSFNKEGLENMDFFYVEEG